MVGKYWGPPEAAASAESLVSQLRSAGGGDVAVWAYLQAEAESYLGVVTFLLEGECDEETSWRLQWQRAMGRALAHQLSGQIGRRAPCSFEAEACQLYDCELEPEYAAEAAVADVQEALAAALPPMRGGLLEAWNYARRPFLISEAEYVELFRGVLRHVEGMMACALPMHQWELSQVYYKDPEDLAEAYCVYKGGKRSVMKVNIARPIDLCKCQQLVCHEYTHHVQFCLAAEHLLPSYPELQCDIDFSPWAFILEAGAEVAVDAVFTPERRKEHLRRLRPIAAGVADNMVDLDRLAWREMWRLWTAVARDLKNGRISKDEAEKRLLREGLKPPDSWPNAGFMAEYGAYVLGYGWGSELLRRYLRHKYPEQSMWEAYMQFMKRPVPPGVMSRALGAHRAPPVDSA